METRRRGDAGKHWVRLRRQRRPQAYADEEGSAGASVSVATRGREPGGRRMASEVWGRDPQEAFENPYEYGIQEQFVREAEAVLRGLYRLLNCSRHHYTLEDRSAKKAVWLLAMDALDSLREALAALVRKEHRVAGKLFRDISESVDLATFFKDFPTQSRRFLHEWYADGIVPHREYRDAVKKKLGPDMASKLSQALLEPLSFHTSILSCDSCGLRKGGRG